MVADNTTTITPDGAVLYIDHARHLSPITLTYHATASRHLTSGRSDIIPPSTSVEVETAYCPRCLAFCDAASASTSLGVCQKDSGGCKDCPICLSPISISIDQHPSTETHLICQYICGHCSWSSHSACGVSVNADKLLEYSNIHDDETEKKRLVVISEITTELEACFQGKVCSRNQSGDALFHSIVDMWTQKEQEEDRRRRMMISTTTLVNEGKKGYEKTTWSLGALEQSLTEKKRDLDSPHINDCKVIDAKKLPPSTENDSQAVDKVQLLRPTPQQMAAQMSLVINVPRCREDLLPLPVRYRTRVSRRCRAEQAAGRTGILVKPKLNPLEGDTSLRAGHGQWWKKDSSAVHVVPRVQICRSGTDPATGKVAALLKVKNPTMSMIRLRFSSPSYPDDGVFIDKKELENILIDPFMETAIARAELCSSSSLSSITASDWIELESAEDLLLDIGKQYEEDPQVVKSWEAVPILDALHNNSLPRFNVVASRRDTSWVEMILPDAVATGIDGEEYHTKNNHLAIPLSIQIEVGNGSWEASLIKRKDVSEESQKDLVDLDLVVLLGS